jgi:hypothetical protein
VNPPDENIRRVVTAFTVTVLGAMPSVSLWLRLPGHQNHLQFSKKRQVTAGLMWPTPGWSLSVQSLDAHARMRTLLEASDTPRSDLKADDHVNPQATNWFLPDGVDIAAVIRRAAAGYRTDGIDLNPTPRAAQMKPITLAESRAELATRIPDPIQRAYVILSERD